MRYEASASLASEGVGIFVTADAVGARFDVATRKLLLLSREDESGLWEDVVGAAKRFRWRLLTQPQPIELNSALVKGSEDVIREANRMRGAIANESILNELTGASLAALESNPALGSALELRITKNGVDECIVVAASAAASTGIGQWLGPRGVIVLAVGEIESLRRPVEKIFVVGPPRFFRPSVVTAPVSNSIDFLVPDWFGDRTIPHSIIAPYAEGALVIRPNVVLEDGSLAPETTVENDSGVTEDEFALQPVWGRRQSPDREPSSEEVVAHKVVLSGGLAMWLDDGERIRVVDTEQPPGERVHYIDVASVRPGTYLLVRQGETERGALYNSALGRLDNRRSSIEASQQLWKSELQKRLDTLGYRNVVRELRHRGVSAADQARAWTDGFVVRPQSDRDFEQLLDWAGLPIQPAFGNATTLRRELSMASAEIRSSLEVAMSAANLTALEKDGYLELEASRSGVRGIAATRVLAISPFAEIVLRRDSRVPFQDRGGQWLE